MLKVAAGGAFFVEVRSDALIAALGRCTGRAARTAFSGVVFRVGAAQHVDVHFVGFNALLAGGHEFSSLVVVGAGGGAAGRRGIVATGGEGGCETDDCEEREFFHGVCPFWGES